MCGSLWRGLAVVVLMGIAGPWEVEAARIRAWGWIDEETYPVPEGDDFVAIAAGASHNVALREDGSLAQWGPGIDPKWPMPEDKDFVAIAAGHRGDALAIRSDGSLVLWGPSHTAPEGSNYIAVGLGVENLVALDDEGGYTQRGHCNSMNCWLPPPSNYIAINVEGYVTAGLRADGSVASAYLITDGVPSGSDFVAVAAGWMHVLALREDGTLAAWGAGSESGTLDVPMANDFVAIAAGEDFNLALRADGSLTAWGRDSVGQLDVPSGSGFVAISAYAATGLALEVPEPSTLALLGAGGFGLAAFSARREKRSVVGASHFMHGRIDG